MYNVYVICTYKVRNCELPKTNHRIYTKAYMIMRCIVEKSFRIEINPNNKCGHSAQFELPSVYLLI